MPFFKDKKQIQSLRRKKYSEEVKNARKELQQMYPESKVQCAFAERMLLKYNNDKKV